MNGSVYAEVQHWAVNVDMGEAVVDGGMQRQVGTQNRPLKTEPLAERLATATIEYSNDPQLSWDGPERVKVLIGKVVRATNKQTTSERRNRLWKSLEEKVRPFGWQRPFSHPYRMRFVKPDAAPNSLAVAPPAVQCRPAHAMPGKGAKNRVVRMGQRGPLWSDGFDK